MSASGGELGLVLRDACAARGVPGAVVGLLADGAATIACHGVQNVQQPTPMTAASHVQVASITKTFTAAAVLLLVEDGSVALDDPVARHLPELGPATGLDTESITVQHLLSHQAGFDGDHLFVTGAQDLAALADARRLFEPGRGFSYSNAGFSIAGELVACVAGQPFDVFLRHRLLEPLGLRSAGFRADEVITFPVASPHWVWEGQAHVVRGGGWQPRWELGPLDWAAGGLVATVEHLLRWGRFQWEGTADDDAQVLSAESLARLHHPVVERAEPLDQVALDWYVRDIDGVRTLGHGGVTPGYVSDLLVLPDRRAVVVCLTNATNGAAVVHEVRRWVLAHHLGLHEAHPPPDRATAVDPTRLTGTYVHSFCLLDVEPGPDAGAVRVVPRANRDAVGWQPPLDASRVLAFTNETDAVSVDHDPGDPPRVVRFGFEATADGDTSATWLQWGGRLAPRAS